jgi:E3 ubiquitin-protein ligase NEDD4
MLSIMHWVDKVWRPSKINSSISLTLFRKGLITEDLRVSSDGMPVNGQVTFSFSPASEVPSTAFADLRVSGPSSHVHPRPRPSQANLRSSRSRANLNTHEESPRPAMPTPGPSVLPTSVRPTTAPNSLTRSGAVNPQPSAGPPGSRDPSPRPSTAGQNAQQGNMFTDASGNNLPAGWERRLDDRGRNYYVNRETRQSTWQSPASAEAPHPAPAPVSASVPSQGISNVNANNGPYTDISLPLGWEERRTNEGQASIL